MGNHASMLESMNVGGLINITCIELCWLEEISSTSLSDIVLFFNVGLKIIGFHLHGV